MHSAASLVLLGTDFLAERKRFESMFWRSRRSRPTWRRLVGRFLNWMGNGYLYRWVIAALRSEGMHLRILDAGCGRAVLAGRLKGQRYFGVDFSRHLLVEAPAKVCQADIRRMPFSDSCFDVVVSIQSVIYAAPAAVAFNEFRRVLKPGGLLLVTVPNLQTRKYRQLGPPPLVAGDWSVQSVTQLLAGFDVEEIAWIGRWIGHPVLPVRLNVHLPIAGDIRTAMALAIKARKPTGVLVST